MANKPSMPLKKGDTIDAANTFSPQAVKRGYGPNQASGGYKPQNSAAKPNSVPKLVSGIKLPASAKKRES